MIVKHLNFFVQNISQISKTTFRGQKKTMLVLTATTRARCITIYLLLRLHSMFLQQQNLKDLKQYF